MSYGTFKSECGEIIKPIQSVYSFQQRLLTRKRNNVGLCDEGVYQSAQRSENVGLADIP